MLNLSATLNRTHHSRHKKGFYNGSVKDPV